MSNGINDGTKKAIGAMDTLADGANKLLEKLEELKSGSKKINSSMDKQVAEADKVVKKAYEISAKNIQVQKILKNATRGVNLESSVTKKKGKVTNTKEFYEYFNALDNVGRHADKIYDSLHETMSKFSNLKINDVVKQMDKIDEKSIEKFVNIFNNVHPNGNLNEFKDQLYDFIKLRQIYYENEQKYNKIKNLGFENLSLSQYQEAIEYLEKMKKAGLEIDRIVSRSDFSGIFTKENNLEFDLKIKDEDFIKNIENDLNNVFDSIADRFASRFKEIVDAYKKDKSNFRTGKEEEITIPKGSVIKTSHVKRQSLDGDYIKDVSKYISNRKSDKKVHDLLGEVYGDHEVTNEKKKEELIGRLANILRLENKTLEEYMSANNKLTDEQKKYVTKLLEQSKYNDIFTRVLNHKEDIIPETKSEQPKLDDTKVKSDVKSVQKTTDATVELNTQLEIERQKLKEIERQQNANDTAFEKLALKKQNYSEYGLDDVDEAYKGKAVYDSDKLKGASDALKEMNPQLEKRNKFQEKYAELCKIIEDYYVGDYSVGRYSSLDDFINSNNAMKKLQGLSNNVTELGSVQGLKGTTTKDIEQLFRQVISGLKSEGQMVSSLVSDGSVKALSVYEELEREEIELGQTRQRLYDEREAQLSRINQLEREQLELITAKEKKENESVASQKQGNTDDSKKKSKKIPKSLDFNIEDLDEKQLRAKIDAANKAITNNSSTADLWKEKLEPMKQALENLRQQRLEAEKLSNAEKEIVEQERKIVEEQSNSPTASESKASHIQSQEKNSYKSQKRGMKLKYFNNREDYDNFVYNEDGSFKTEKIGQNYVHFIEEIEKFAIDGEIKSKNAKEAGYAGVEFKNIQDSFNGISEKGNSVFAIFDESSIKENTDYTSLASKYFNDLESLYNTSSDLLYKNFNGTSSAVYDSVRTQFNNIITLYKQGIWDLSTAIEEMNQVVERENQPIKTSQVSDVDDSGLSDIPQEAQQAEQAVEELNEELEETEEILEDASNAAGSQEFVDETKKKKKAAEQLTDIVEEQREVIKDTNSSTAADQFIEDEKRKQKASQESLDLAKKVMEVVGATSSRTRNELAEYFDTGEYNVVYVAKILSENERLLKDYTDDTYLKVKSELKNRKIKQDDKALKDAFGDDLSSRTTALNIIGRTSVGKDGSMSIIEMLEHLNDQAGTTFDLTTGDADAWRQLHDYLNGYKDTLKKNLIEKWYAVDGEIDETCKIIDSMEKDIENITDSQNNPPNTPPPQNPPSNNPPRPVNPPNTPPSPTPQPSQPPVPNKPPKWKNPVIKGFDDLDGEERIKETHVRGDRYKNELVYRTGLGQEAKSTYEERKDKKGNLIPQSYVTTNTDYTKAMKTYVDTWKRLYDIKYELKKLDSNSDEYKALDQERIALQKPFVEYKNAVETYASYHPEIEAYHDSYLTQEQELYRTKKAYELETDKKKKAEKLSKLDSKFKAKFASVDKTFASSDEYKLVEALINGGINPYDPNESFDTLTKTKDVFKRINEIEAALGVLEARTNEYKQNVRGFNTLDPVAAANKKINRIETADKLKYIEDFKLLGLTAQDAENKVQALTDAIAAYRSGVNAQGDLASIWEQGEQIKAIQEEDEKLKNTIALEKKQQITQRAEARKTHQDNIFDKDFQKSINLFSKLEEELKKTNQLDKYKDKLDDIIDLLFDAEGTKDKNKLSEANKDIGLLKDDIKADEKPIIDTYDKIIDKLKELKQARTELAKLNNEAAKNPTVDYSKDIEYQKDIIESSVKELLNLKDYTFVRDNKDILGEDRVKEYEQASYEAERVNRRISNEEEIRKEKQEQTELNESVKEFNKLQKEREQTNKTENKNANALIQEELRALERKNKLEIEKVNAEKKGQDTTAIQKKIDLEEKFIKKFNEELEYYKETQAYKDKDAIFANKEKELKTDFDLKVNKGRLSFDVAEEEAWKLHNALEEVENTLKSIKTAKGLDDDDLVTKDAVNKLDALNNKLINTKNIDNSTLIKYSKDTRKILEDLDSVVRVASPNLSKDDITKEVADYINIITNGKAKIEGFDYVNNKVFATFKDEQGNIKKIVLEYDSLTGALRQVKDEGKKTQSTFDKIFSFFKEKGKNLLGYVLSFASFYEIWAQIRQGVTYIRELNTALTEMRKVSDESIETLKNFQKASFDTANSIGTTAKQIQDSTSDFMRLGYELEQASQLANDANIYANVGDMEINEATEHMISSIKAWESEFDSEVEASAAIVDRYNEIGNNFAISSADIGSAMERSAAALKAGGNTLNESLGLITAGNVIQQDAETTAAALKILALRIRGSKAELEEMGESTDDLASSSSKLREQIKGLSGVDIMLDEDTYKSTAQIIKELGVVYNQMSDVSQASLLETIAGKNRASTIEGLLQNYEIIDEVISAAENADGSALKENEKYLESIDGKIEQLTNSIQEFWYTVLDTDTVSWVLDSLTSIINLVTDLIDKFGVLPSLMGTAGGAFGVFQSIEGGGRAKNFVVISKLITHRSLINIY